MKTLLSFRFPSVRQPSTIRAGGNDPTVSRWLALLSRRHHRSVAHDNCKWALPKLGTSQHAGKNPYSCGHAAMLQQTHVAVFKRLKDDYRVAIHSGNPCQPSSIKAWHKVLNTAQMRKTLLMWPGQKEWRKTVAPAAAQILLREWSCFCFEVVGRHPRQLYFQQDIEAELKSSQTSKFGNCRILSETPSQLQKVFKVERHGSLSTCFSFGAGRMEGCLETGVLTVLCSNPRQFQLWKWWL